MNRANFNLKEVLQIENDTEAITHSGMFHADDVFSTALLTLVKPDIKINRIARVPDGYKGLVYDIGYGRYDHHQADKRTRENGIAYAAFGLLWEKIGPALLGQELSDRIDKSFVEKIDYSDNTGIRNMLSTTISEFNPCWDEDKTSDECFFEAVSFAKRILERKINYEISAVRAKKVIYASLDKSYNRCVLLEKPMPWKDVLVGTDTEFVIYPSVRGGYIVQTVPRSNDDSTPVIPLPKEWLGKNKSELEKISGIASITFCHASGYLAGAEELGDVWRMIDIAKNNTAKMAG